MKIIYVMDPLCGWCYGNHNTIEKLYTQYQEKFDFEILPAGMWSGSKVQRQSPQMAQFIINHDRQIAQTCGVTFGDSYYDFVSQEEAVLDSEIPSRAINSVMQMQQEKTVPFMIAVQKARYFHGLDLNEESTYLSICEQLDLNKEDFLSLFHSKAMMEATQKVFKTALGYAQSYPTLLMEINGQLSVLEQGYASYESINNQIIKALNQTEK